MSALSTADALADYHALRSAAVVIHLPRTQFSLAGEDRTTFLNAFCTGNIKTLQPGSGCEAFITNHQGKAAGHVLIFCETDRLFLEGAPGQAEKLMAHLDRFVISERVIFEDLSTRQSELLLAGPNAIAILQKFEVAPLPERLAHTAAIIAGVNVTVRNVDLLSVPSFFLSAATESITEVERALLAGGAIACGEAAFEMARVEAGYPIFGRDITEDNLPQEVQRNTQAISFTKGCYLGQETIARLDALGHVNRVLTGLKLPAGHGLAQAQQSRQGDKKLAQITSIAYSPQLQSDLALAYVRTLHTTPGKKLAFTGGEAEVVALPLSV